VMHRYRLPARLRSSHEMASLRGQPEPASRHPSSHCKCATGVSGKACSGSRAWEEASHSKG
jgi:hypothetical protein